MTTLTHQYIKEAFYELCATFEVRFHGEDYDSIEVIGMEKPTWEEVLAKANEIELINLKPHLKRMAKNIELEARKKAIGDASEVLVSHWNNQKIIAEKILTATATTEEILAFQTEIDLRGLDETLEVFSLRVLEKSNSYTLINCTITGGLKRVNFAVETATTKAEAFAMFETFKTDIEIL
jgi:hypothetical protein